VTNLNEEKQSLMSGRQFKAFKNKAPRKHGFGLHTNKKRQLLSTY
jgi:hypothetical protein